jgi:uncharacterized SAM-binding protein YcdF (DUF218 family)
MLTLTKILSLLVYPLSLGLLLFCLALLGQLKGNRASAGIYTFAAVIVLYWCSTDYGATTLGEPLESAYAAFAPEELPNADAIVVLGGATEGVTRYGRGSDLNDAADRLFTAVELYRAQKAPIFVLSGGALDDEQPESEAMAAKLRIMGIPDDVIRQERESLTTYENGVNTASLLSASGDRHILLVTSADHMRRALAVFQAQGLQVTAVPSDHTMLSGVQTVPRGLPTVERLARSTRAIHEWVGYWVYSITGKLAPATNLETTTQT